MDQFFLRSRSVFTRVKTGENTDDFKGKVVPWVVSGEDVLLYYDGHPATTLSFAGFVPDDELDAIADNYGTIVLTSSGDYAVSLPDEWTVCSV